MLLRQQQCIRPTLVSLFLLPPFELFCVHSVFRTMQHMRSCVVRLSVYSCIGGCCCQLLCVHDSGPWLHSNVGMWNGTISISIVSCRCRQWTGVVRDWDWCEVKILLYYTHDRKVRQLTLWILSSSHMTSSDFGLMSGDVSTATSSIPSLRSGATTRDILEWKVDSWK